MTVINIFSKRQKKLRGEIPDVFEYAVIPIELRNQVLHIWIDAIGKYNSSSQVNQIYELIRDSLCREYGKMSLGNKPYLDRFEDLIDFFINSTNHENALDVIEFSFQLIDRVCRRPDYKSYVEPDMNADDAISELNHRFLEHGIGYQYESGQIIRADSMVLHQEVIKPTLQLLSYPEYKGANDEFLKAHEHYRRGKYKECINESLKAFESTMKIICKAKKWPYKETDQAKTLIGICFENNLIPQFLQSEFTSLRSLMESGVPTTRNKTSGHGQGAEIHEVPQYMASYILNTAGSSILFLVSAAITK